MLPEDFIPREFATKPNSPEREIDAVSAQTRTAQVINQVHSKIRQQQAAVTNRISSRLPQRA
jgi:hypothetical protein